jgi:oligopeptide transport system ATP-binding protein
MVDTLLEVSGLTRWYKTGGLLSGPRRFVQAVTDVSFSVRRGESVGLIGESGCGKSTLARAVMGLEPLRSGSVTLAGQTISGLSDGQLRMHRRTMQMIWQNPASAVNSRMRVDRIILEPLDIHNIGTRSERRRRLSEMLELVSLRADVAFRYPHELSGGQLQRVVIARALAIDPVLLVCDEPTAALDVSIRAQIVNLLADLKERLNLTMLYISHDLSTVRAVSDRVLVMYLGRVVEETTASAFATGGLRHPYAVALRAAVPIPDPSRRRGEPQAMGEVPNAATPPSGCAYHPRCRLAQAVCAEIRPSLAELGADHRVACHAIVGPYRGQWPTEPRSEFPVILERAQAAAPDSDAGASEA